MRRLRFESIGKILVKSRSLENNQTKIKIWKLQTRFYWVYIHERTSLKPPSTDSSGTWAKFGLNHHSLLFWCEYWYELKCIYRGVRAKQVEVLLYLCTLRLFSLSPLKLKYIVWKFLTNRIPFWNYKKKTRAPHALPMLVCEGAIILLIFIWKRAITPAI